VRSALAVLAKTEGAEAIPAIAAKLSSHDATVRRAAAEALGEIGGPKARAALQKQLDAEDQPEVRAAIERAMAKASP
jgi:HEAT repeat protein